MHYLHVRAVDAAGRAGETAHYRIGVTAQMARENVYNYPNPARTGNTTVRFFLSQSAGVTLRIFNAAHEEIHHASLEGASGRNAYDWSTADVANGVYFCKITAGGEDVVLKILVLR